MVKGVGLHGEHPFHLVIDGRPIPLVVGEVACVGRAPDNNIVLSDGSVSSHHARIAYAGGRPWIHDLSSKNGVKVNGVRVAHTGCALAAGDKLEIGAIECRVASSAKTSSPVSDLPVASSVDTAACLTTQVIGRTAADKGSAEYLLALMMRAGAFASEQGAPEDFLKQLLELALEALSARRGAVFLMTPAGSMPVQFLDGESRSDASFSVSQSLISSALNGGRSVLVGDLGTEDPSQSMVAKGVDTALCVPIVSGSSILGALYLEGSRGFSPLGRRDLELATVLATQAGIGCENRRLAMRAETNDRFAAIGLAVAETAHDLATYLTRVQCAEYLLGDWFDASLPEGTTPDGWPQLKEALASTYAVVRDLKNAARQKDPNRLPYLPGSTLQSVLKVCMPVADRWGVALRADDGTGDETAEYDLAWIERALVNLVRNAVEASSKGGEVVVSSRFEGEHVLFSVCDRGRGIPVAEQARVLDPFFTSGKAHGTGLGLAIAQRIAAAHGGALTFTTELGTGTTFTLRLPARARKGDQTLEDGP